MKTVISLIIICVILSTCQSPQEQVNRSATEQEVLEINMASIYTCGTFEFASGTSLNECTETYTITSDSLFVVTDRYGHKRVAEGPLKIEVSRYMNFDGPTCIEDLIGNYFLFEGDGHTLCPGESYDRAP